MVPLGSDPCTLFWLTRMYHDDETALRTILICASAALAAVCIVRMLPTILYLARYGIPE
jgi:hypothetical protein